MSDTSLDELHVFALSLGMPREAFQGDHYDVHEDLRALAIEYGAEQVNSRELVQRLRSAGLRKRPRRV